jgi:hypothetical protein
VLSPKSPKLNGAVERCNPAWRYEFYSVYDLPRNAEAINRILDASITSKSSQTTPEPLAGSLQLSTLPS